MKKYVLVVYGPAADSARDRAAGMAMMAEWYESLGPALVDPGAPFTGAKTVTADAVGAAVGPHATGYNIVQADSMEAATLLAARCPLLAHGRQITVFETLPS
jgi:hypothetical protein